MRFWRDVGEAMTEAFEQRREIDLMFVEFCTGMKDLVLAFANLAPDEIAKALSR